MPAPADTGEPMRQAIRMGALLGLSAVSGCANLPHSAHASARVADYYETPRELTPAVERAIELGHVVEGMDREQVWVVFGEPIRKTRYSSPGAPEVWIYPGHKFHQDPVRGHGVTLFRVVFIDGRVALVETL